ncbi:MAG TPA: hypothetical protein VH186_15635 [Chloroflexia bacterium]|nr:hypothetical protein [Chloroflexia bacterium]
MQNQIDLITLEAYVTAEGPQLESERVQLQDYLAQVQEGLATIAQRQQFLETVRQAIESKRRQEEQEGRLKAELVGLTEQEANLHQELSDLEKQRLQVDQQLAAWQSMLPNISGLAPSEVATNPDPDVETSVGTEVKPQAKNSTSTLPAGTLSASNIPSANVTTQVLEESESSELEPLEFIEAVPSDFDPLFNKTEVETVAEEVSQEQEVSTTMLGALSTKLNTHKVVEKVGDGAGQSLTKTKRPAPL